MAKGEVYITPHPDKSIDASVERAGMTEFEGTTGVGRLIAATDDGLISTTLMPFAQSPDVTDEPVETARLPVRVESPSGLVWRWLSITAILNWINDQIMDIVSPVGTVRLALGAEPGTKWLALDGRTLGSTASGAILAGEAYKRLYTVLWTSLSADVIKIYEATGIGTTKGTSAENDWALGKRIEMPAPSGRMLMLAGAGSGLTTRKLGEMAGEEEVQLSVLTMPKHNHKMYVAQSGTAQRVEFLDSVTVDVSISNNAETTLSGDLNATIGYSKVEDHSHGVSVTVNSGNAAHDHDVTLPGADLTHTHAADNGTTVDAASLAVTGSSIKTSQATAPHTHLASGSATSTTTAGNGHKHDLTLLSGYTADTRVTSTPTVTVRPNKKSAQMYDVSEGNATATDVGGDAKHNNMPPFFGLVAYVRY